MNGLQNKIACVGDSPTEHILASLLKFEVQPTTEVHVLKIITKLANGKATCLHDIPTWVLKNCEEKITPTLSYIFYLSVRTRVFPDDFKIAKVLPVFKTGDKGDQGNYIPISFLPTVAKVLRN